MRLKLGDSSLLYNASTSWYFC